MNIFENLIKDTEIIGIGALNCSETPAGSQGGINKDYSFRIFTKQSNITIYSPRFHSSQKNTIDAWLKQYLLLRSSVAAQIGELSNSQ